MYTIRLTRILLDRLPKQHATDDDRTSTTCLGDWFVKPYNVGRNRLLLCTSSASLLTLLVPAAKLPAVGARLRETVRDLLYAFGLPLDVINREVTAMSEHAFAPTNSRRVLGWMNEMAFTADGFPVEAFGGEHLVVTAMRLSNALSRPLNYASPREVAIRLLTQRRVSPSTNIN